MHLLRHRDARLQQRPVGGGQHHPRAEAEHGVHQRGTGAAGQQNGRRAKRLRRLSPQTGLAGELVVMEGYGRVRRGMRYPVIREGTLGSGHAADVRVRHGSVRARHARFEMTDQGLLLTAAPGATLADAQGRRARKLLARDGDSFYVGSILLMLVLIDAAGRSGAYEAQEDLFSAGGEVGGEAAAAPEDLFGDGADVDETEDLFGAGQGGRWGDDPRGGDEDDPARDEDEF